jgi:acetyl-CoA decarbonylase/synthase complex subunit delta
MIIDPTTGGLGYGMEYSYSVMERIRMAAMNQGDDKLQFPIINNIGNEVWKCKEAKQSADEAPELGDPEKCGILMEAIAAVVYLMAGSDILILRHPETVRMVRAFIDLIADGGAAGDIAPIKKQLDDVDIDYASLAPAPDLTIEKEKPKAPAKKAAPPKAEKAPEKAKAPAAKPKAKAAPKVEPKPEVKAKAEKEEIKDDTEAKAKAEAEAKAKIEAEGKAKAEAEAKAKAEAEAKAKADAKAKAKAEAEVIAKREAEEDEIRQKRTVEREALAAKRKTEAAEGEVPMTPAAKQKTEIEKILNRLDRIHRRIPLY